MQDIAKFGVHLPIMSFWEHEGFSLLLQTRVVSMNVIWSMFQSANISVVVRIIYFGHCVWLKSSFAISNPQ
jgi:hypothetical protein